MPTSGDALPDEVSMPDRQHILGTVAETIMRLPASHGAAAARRREGIKCPDMAKR